MKSSMVIAAEGIGVWTRGAPDWPTLRTVLCGERGLREDAPSHPAAAGLPAAERRRAPDSVRLAVEVAAQAAAMAHRDPAALPCVFASTHGELAIIDYMCEVLARAPRELSPTKFHNSVHNAPVGYWTIAAQCTAASSAVAAHQASFGAGLLEAAALAVADQKPVLFVACDVAATGPLAEMVGTTLPFGTALVLAPASRTPRITLSLKRGAALPLAQPCLALRAIASDNPLNAHALALLAALAGACTATLSLPSSPTLSLDMEIKP